MYLRAEPESEDDEFLHWSVEFVDQVSASAMSATSAAVDPRDCFDDYESPDTYFEVPGKIRPFIPKELGYMIGIPV
ncbi:MAG: hypothetical protein GX249_03435 [Firmicutes bacterium]|nr:hypothetical protein [Bacillota bacterium]